MFYGGLRLYTYTSGYFADLYEQIVNENDKNTNKKKTDNSTIKKLEKDLIEEVKNAVFSIDERMTLEQALRRNPYTERVIWNLKKTSSGRILVGATIVF